jgi:hypothetical protein
LEAGGRTEAFALSLGERVSRSGAFTSRSGTGEGSLARFREPTSSPAQPGLAGRTGGEPLPSASGPGGTMSRFELRFGCVASGGPHGEGGDYSCSEALAGQDGLQTEETPHPSGDGWRKRRRRTPSPQGRGLYFRVGHLRCPAKDVGHCQPPRGRGLKCEQELSRE